MGGASKLLMLLSSPLPHPCSAFRLTRHPRITITALSSFPKRRFSSTTTINCRPLLRFSIHNPTSHEQIHTHTASVTRDDFHTNLRSSHPWPEWSKLVDNLRVGGYFDSQVGLDGENALSVFKDLPQDFLQAVTACLAFARCRTDLLRSLSRKDIEIVVGNGSPILFKNGVDSARRMKSFLRNYEGNELEFERASTVDLMRFLLSYAYNPLVSDRNNFGNGELVEASARNLLSELADASTVVHEFDPSSSMPKQLSDRYGQTTRPLRQNIEMKRGDWICPRCSFMNFARNMKCLDCNEARPNRQLTGGEWECPQCDFFNYGKNVVCLRCDCRRSGEVSFRTAESQFSAGFNNESDLDKADMTNSRTTLGNDGNEGNSFRSVDGRSLGKSTSTHMSQSLDRVLGCTSPVSEMNYNATAGNNTAGEGSSFSSSTSPQFRPREGIKSDYVPFVPLPTDTFAIPQKHTEKLTGNSKSIGQKSSVDSFPFSQKSVNRTDCKENKEQAEQSERWSHDDADITNAISDEDFPEIMPMRKGESRFVVGKKKDRSLTSPLHKRRMAMEQTNTTNFVPFVPFPPDYFAKKDKEPESGATSTTPEVHAEPQKSEEHNVGLPDSRVTRYSPQSVDNGLTNGDNWSTSFSGKSMNESKVDHGYSGYSTQRTSDLRSGDGESWSGSSWNNNRSGASTSVGSLSQQSEKVENTRESWKGGFSGKSLEGSLVKEPDPLDMSEEAKAERFFRRVAQIKDISELSQIPDEDFPQIMPMRKGVNRFVVSKRKTPLERRLTSSQYRRNLPIVNSELKKEENNES